MNLSPVVLAIPIYFLLIGVELIVEQITKKRTYRLNEALTNINCGITSQITGVFLRVISIGVYEVVYHNWAFFHIPYLWWSVAICFVLYDLAYYWAHRMSHEINLFWGGHSVHHQSEDYNLSVALRQSSTQTIWSFPFYLPIALLGFDTWTFIWASGLNLIYQFWIHTESIGKMGFFEKFLNTPSHHRVHHGRDPKYIDKNHAGALIIWDKMFGTFQEEEEKPHYGVTTPLNSLNAVWANFIHYNFIYENFKKANSWKDKIKLLFNKPGWRPDYLGGYIRPKEIGPGYEKYNPDTTSGLNLYIIIHYLIILVITSFFLFNQSSFGLTDKVLIVTAIIHAIINFGGIFEKRRWIFISELLRLATIPVLIYYYLGNYQNFNILFIGTLFFCMLSFFFIIKNRSSLIQSMVYGK